MTDPGSTALDPVIRATGGPWTRYFVTFLRVMAGISMLKGLYHWAMVCGIGDETGLAFQLSPTPFQAATIYFAVIDLVAAVGLWLAAAWGGVVWLTAAISMAAVEMFFPQIFGGRLWVAMAELLAVFAYLGLAFAAARERPD